MSANDEPAADARAAFARADALFDALLELAPGERAAALERATRDDPALRARVERLLHAVSRSDGFLDVPAMAMAAPLLDGPATSDTGANTAATDATADAGATEGTRLGRYLLLRRLGQGGMGTVWLARDEQLDRDVAIKIVGLPATAALPAGDTPDKVESCAPRAIREARAAARLDHPNVAGVYDVGTTARGQLWFAMPHCPGGSLADRMRHGRIPVRDALEIARQLARALAAAHAQGIVHCDVKPANVLFDASGQVRLSDFGIAKLSGHDTTTAAQGVVGTLQYLAPEHLHGTTLTPQTDLWALGVTLHETLTGTRPFARESAAATMHAILTEPPPGIPRSSGLDESLLVLVRGLLQKAPSDRPGSAEAVVDWLSALIDGRAPETRVTTAPRPRMLFGATLLVTALVAVVLFARDRTAGDPALAGAATAASDSPSGAPAARASIDASSLAVLPFENSSRDPADEPFVDGLTEEVTGALGRVAGLKVSSRTSVYALRGKGLAVRALADTLRVAHVLETSVRRDGRRLRVSARLVRAADDRVLWANEFEGELQLQGVLDVQQRIATAIVDALQPRLGTGTALSAPPQIRGGTDDMVAYDLYLRARFLRFKRAEEPLRLSESLYEQAIGRDSSFARAWAGLSSVYVLQVIFANRPPGPLMVKARAAARRAIALDSTLAEGHAAYGHVLRVHDFDWPAALRESERAMALDPGDETVRVLHAITLLDLGRLDEAEAILEAARVLNPADFAVDLTRGRVYLEQGRANEAVAALRSALERNPQFVYAHQQLGYALLQVGRPDEALAAFTTAAQRNGAQDSAHLAYALAVTGHRDSAARMVAGLERSASSRYLAPVSMAVAYAGLRDHDAAFRWLERAWVGRAPYLDALQSMPPFYALENDPRWTRLIQRVGLPSRRH